MCFPPRTAYVLALMHEHKPRLSCVPHKNPSCCRAGRFLNDFSLSIVCSTISIIVTQQIGSYWINYLSLQIYTGTMEKSYTMKQLSELPAEQRPKPEALRRWVQWRSAFMRFWCDLCIYILYVYDMIFTYIYTYIIIFFLSSLQGLHVQVVVS